MKRKLLLPGLLGVGLIIVAIAIVTSCKKKDETPPVLGCMDSGSLTYNPLATEDDGSCLVPEQKMRSVLFDFTGTWCSPCGSQGIPMFEAAITANAANVIPLACHNSDEMSNPTSEALLDDYGVTGIPTIAVSNMPDVWGATAINNAITSTNSSAPEANACGLMTNSGSTITVKTQTKFFMAVSGNYYLATYFVENGLLYSQTSATPDPYNHKHVLRGVAAGTEHGELIASGSIASGTVVKKDYTYTAPGSWTVANVYIALVLWKKDGTVWSIVNAWQSKAN
jgi:hypothetical protein